VEGAAKHLLPVSREMYRDMHAEGYAEAFVGLCIGLSALTVFTSVFDIKIITILSISPELADAAFFAGGVMAFALRRHVKKKVAATRNRLVGPA
jgi:hypothetical protein